MNFLKSYGLFIFAAVLISLAMDFPQTLWFFIFLFLIPILYYIDKTKTDAKKNIFSLFKKKFLFSFVFTMLSSLWFLSTYPLDWLKIYDPILSILIIGSIWVSFCLTMSLPIAFWVVFINKFKINNLFINALVGASLWVILEYFRSWFVAISLYGSETLFGPHHTYYSLAYVIATVPIMKELIPVGGIYLASFVIILINYFFYYCWLTVKSEVKKWKSVTNLFIFIIFIITISYISMVFIRGSDKNTPSFTASIVTMYLPRTTSQEINIEKGKKTLEMIDTIKNSDGIIILPENIDVLNIYQNINDRLRHSESKINLIVGSFRRGDYYSMFFSTPNNNNVSFYNKQLLMPIGEYGLSFVRLLIEATQNWKWLLMYDNAMPSAKKGNGIFLFKYPSAKYLTISGVLCSENVSPYIFRKETREGANVLLNLSSRTNFHQSSLLFRQTLAINTTRALENGRYLITANNNERSFVITDDGNISNISPSEKINSYFNSNIKILNYRTPYIKYGDLSVYISAMFLFIFYILYYKNK